MSLTFTLASRNLFQDRLRFTATIVGIVFSIVLVTIQLGLLLSFERMVTAMPDHASADLWVVPFGTKCFEDPSLLNARDQAKILDIQGVADAVPLVIGFTQWAVPTGGVTPVFVIGSDAGAGGLHPWNVVMGSVDTLSAAGSVAVDKTYADRLGVAKVGDTTEIREQPVRVVAVTDGIRSFTTTPYIFTSLANARSFVATPPNRVSYFLVHLSADTDIAQVKERLVATLPKIEVLTPGEFSRRGRTFWLFGTGAGAALFAGALLGAIVGAVIVAQTLYSSTKDHLSEFATLRAIGSSSGYIHKVIIYQALLSAVIGFALADCIGFAIVRSTAETALPIVMTPGLTLALLMPPRSSCASCRPSPPLVKVLRIDPAVAFRQ